MFKNMGVGKKIAFGFGVVLILMAVVAVWSYYGISGINNSAASAVEGNDLKAHTLEKEIDHLNWAGDVTELLTDDNITELTVQTDPHKCAFGQWYYGEERKHAEELYPELKEYLEAIEEPHNHLHQSAVEIGKVYHQADVGLPLLMAEREGDHLTWVNTVMDLFLENHSHLDVETDHHKCGLGQFLFGERGRLAAQSDPEIGRLIEAIKGPHENLHKSAKHIQTVWDNTDNEAKSRAHEILNSETLPSLKETQKYLNEIKNRANEMVEGVKKANEIYAAQTMPNLQKVQNYLGKINDIVGEKVEETNDNLISQAASTKMVVMIVSIVAAIIGIFLAFTISRGIIRSLKTIIGSLKDGSEQVSSAAAQVSSASQSLAEGASEQASSLEETSSSLEEMSGMTKQNADNANQANSLASQARTASEKGGDAMRQMSEAINQIKSSSDETAKIIKVIDEIAFQTNLLALNAAVEAARAGEAGKGFAVVAEEVRNLAMRSAEAAKNTSALIEESQNNADNGVRVTDEFTNILNEISTSINKVSDLVGEVSAASNEQAQGINQVNTAVTQIDQVTQQNASNAEESASASEELSAQAAQMQQIVNDLTLIVNGGNSTNEPTRSFSRSNANYSKHNETKTDWKQSGLKDRFKLKRKNSDADNTSFDEKSLRSEEVIPLEEDHKELAEF